MVDRNVTWSTEPALDGRHRGVVHVPGDPRSPLRSVPMRSKLGAEDWARATAASFGPGGINRPGRTLIIARGGSVQNMDLRGEAPRRPVNHDRVSLELSKGRQGDFTKRQRHKPVPSNPLPAGGLKGDPKGSDKKKGRG